jgi:hypothetical protein
MLDQKNICEQKKLMSIDSLLNLDKSKDQPEKPPKKKSANSILNNLKGFDQDRPKAGSGGFWDSKESSEFEKKISPQTNVPMTLKKRVTMPSIVENLGAPLPTITSLTAGPTDRTINSIIQPELESRTETTKILAKSDIIDPPKGALRSTKS